ELERDAVFVLHSDCRFNSCEPSPVIETDDEVFTFQGVDSKVFTEILTRLDGTRRIGEIASSVGASDREVMEICAPLYRYSLVARIDSNHDSADAQADFSHLCYSL